MTTTKCSRPTKVAVLAAVLFFIAGGSALPHILGYGRISPPAAHAQGYPGGWGDPSWRPSTHTTGTGSSSLLLADDWRGRRPKVGFDHYSYTPTNCVEIPSGPQWDERFYLYEAYKFSVSPPALTSQTRLPGGGSPLMT